MSLSIGIVGLPNTGKSTLFNALVRGHQAKVADYPFTTIEPNVGIVEVPDERLDKITEVLKLSKKIPATLEFIDIAGLVKNAHQGEGLGNQFLGHIREVDTIIHVLDDFSKDTKSDEAREIINLELKLAGIKKPTIYVMNIRESQISNLKSQNQENTIYISAKMEAELTELPEKEAQEYLKSYDIQESGLIRLIKESYKLLNLITFYTLKFPTSDFRLPTSGQVQAWPILADTSAPEAAAKVHTDMARGFIAAEVCHYDDLIAAAGWHKAREKGKIRTEGKDYIMNDGDVVLFKFNV